MVTLVLNGRDQNPAGLAKGAAKDLAAGRAVALYVRRPNLAYRALEVVRICQELLPQRTITCRPTMGRLLRGRDDMGAEEFGIGEKLIRLNPAFRMHEPGALTLIIEAR